ncbi:MAG: transposase [Nitrospira sp.]|nr:transposase [Nitrospira sp.]
MDAIPGVDQRVIEGVVAEIGVDMRPFPSDRHLTSWAGICPRHHESADKHTGSKTRKRNCWLRTALMKAALAAIRVKDSRLAARYRRVMRYRGHKKALVAVAHTILVMIYRLLKDQVPRQMWGTTYHEQRDPEQATRQHVKPLERLDHRVILEPIT